MVIQKDENRLDEALAWLEAAEQMAPEQPMYTFQKAHTLCFMGRHEVRHIAEFYLEDMLTIIPLQCRRLLQI